MNFSEDDIVNVPEKFGGGKKSTPWEIQNPVIQGYGSDKIGGFDLPWQKTKIKMPWERRGNDPFNMYGGSIPLTPRRPHVGFPIPRPMRIANHVDRYDRMTQGLWHITPNHFGNPDEVLWLMAELRRRESIDLQFKLRELQNYYREIAYDILPGRGKKSSKKRSMKGGRLLNNNELEQLGTQTWTQFRFNIVSKLDLEEIDSSQDISHILTYIIESRRVVERNKKIRFLQRLYREGVEIENEAEERRQDIIPW